MSNNEIYIILPCFNEEENIESLINSCIDEAKKLEGYSLKILAINDGSTDDTYYILSKLKEKYREIEIINNNENRGLGHSLNIGINHCIEKENCKLICIMDGDNTHDPVYIHSMIRALNEKNVGCVIASRYEKGAKVRGLSFYRNILSYGARILYSSFINVGGVKDYTCGYRLYDKEYLLRVKNYHYKKIVEEKGFSATAEILIKLNKIGCDFAEVPFELKYYRKKGDSKMETFKTIKRSLKLIMRLRKVEKKYEVVDKAI